MREKLASGRLDNLKKYWNKGGKGVRVKEKERKVAGGKNS